MNKNKLKIIGLISLFVVLLSASVLAININSCQTLTEVDSTYYLTSDISVSNDICLYAVVRNITIDCQNHYITGNNATYTAGIYSQANYTTVKNCRISNFDHGIFFYGTDNGLINNTYANTTKSGSSGIWLNSNNKTKIYDTTARSTSGPAILLEKSINGTIMNTSMYSISGTGIQLKSVSKNNTVCLNWFTTMSGIYINDSSGTNNYNCTYRGLNQGNVYANVLANAVNVSGSTLSSLPGLYIGSQGTGYPYNNVTSGSKILCTAGTCVDYAPLTINSITKTIIKTVPKIQIKSTKFVIKS